MAHFCRIMVHDARQDIVIWDTVKSCIFSSGNIYSVQCVREPFLSPSSILIPAPVGQAVEGCRSQGGGRFCQISKPISTGGQIMPTTSLLAPITPPDFQTFLRPCECYCCCHGLIMQNHGPWCKEEEKGSLVKNQSEFMHLWPWMEILTTGGLRGMRITHYHVTMSGKGAFINQSLFDFASLIIFITLITTVNTFL